jgi:hypothetical protein
MLKTVLEELWPGPEDASRFDMQAVGVRLPRPGGGRLVVRLDLRAVICDHAALAAGLGFKGASGTKPCHICTNVVGAGAGRDPGGFLAGRSNPPGSAVFSRSEAVTVSFGLAETRPSLPVATEVGLDAARARLAQHTEATWRAQLQHLEATASAGGPRAAVARVEQALGVKFSAEGPLFAASTRALLPLARLCFDPMHLVLSHGVAASQLAGRGLSDRRSLGRTDPAAQLRPAASPPERTPGASAQAGSQPRQPPPWPIRPGLCPGLLAALKAHGLEPAALDEYCAAWRAPAGLASTGGRPLPEGWFADRFKSTEGSPGPSV